MDLQPQCISLRRYYNVINKTSESTKLTLYFEVDIMSRGDVPKQQKSILNTQKMGGRLCRPRQWGRKYLHLWQLARAR